MSNLRASSLLRCVGVLLSAVGLSKLEFQRGIPWSDLESRQGGAPSFKKCFGLSDCKFPCGYDENMGKCTQCVAPAGGTTQFVACLNSQNNMDSCDITTTTGN